MTNEKAIELLHRLQDEQFDGIHGDERREALEMAVRALSGEGDMISRQAAIDEVINLWADKPFGNPTLVEIKCSIEALPSAQPTQTNAHSTQTNALKRVKGFPIDADLLLIKVLKEYGIMAHDRLYHIIETMDKYEMPSAQPRWIPCSERLPEHNQKILAYYADIDRIMLISFNAHGITTLTAWMPLPEPYGGGDAK